MTAGGDEASRVDRPMGVGLLAVLTLMSALAPLSIDTYLPAMPGVASDLGSGVSAVQLSLTTFLVGLAVGQVVVGPLSDRLGRRRPLLLGSVSCVVASFMCAVAPTVEVLVTARFLQGAAGAAGVVIARAVVADRVHGLRSARVFALMAAVQGLAPVLAPLLGGVLTPLVGWRGIFGALTVLTGLMALGAALLVAESLPAEDRSEGSAAAVVRGLLVVAVDRRFLGPALGLACAFGALFGYIAASPFLVQGVMGLSAGGFSVVFAVNAVGLAASSAMSARLVSGVGPRPLLVSGLLVMLVCSTTLVVVSLATPVHDGLARAAVLALLLGVSIGVGQVFGNATALALAAGSDRAGSASALLGALQFTVGGVASPLAGLGGVRTPLPMALTMTGFSAVALVAFLALSRRPTVE